MNEDVGRVESGFTSCPAASFPFLGCVHEPYTALPGTDERVACLSCNRFTSEFPRGLISDLQALPESVQRLLLDLTSMPYRTDVDLVPVYRLRRIGSKELFSDPMTDDDHQRATAAVAQGHAETLLEEASRVTIQLSLSTKYFLDTVSVSFLPAESATEETGSTFARATALSSEGQCTTKYRPASVSMDELLSQSQISPARARALRAMAEHGFALTSAIDIESSMRRIVLRNDNVDGAKDGVTVEFNWIV